MGFSIVTPSFRSSKWLRLCVASVADQGVEHEHIVQDACSDDGTREWLATDGRVRAYFEKDAGLYDAVNRGWRRATMPFCAQLNADEQYLPGALERVRQAFLAEPALEVLFTHALIVNAEGELVSFRKAVRPQLWHTLVGGSLATLTCATFFRRQILERHGLFYDPRYRSVGDADWIARVLRHGVRIGIGDFPTSAFTLTGKNLSGAAISQQETRELRLQAPSWIRLLRGFVITHFWMRKWLAGAYRREPISYQIYTRNSPTERVSFHARRPSPYYPREGRTT